MTTKNRIKELKKTPFLNSKVSLFFPGLQCVIDCNFKNAVYVIKLLKTEPYVFNLGGFRESWIREFNESPDSYKARMDELCAIHSRLLSNTFDFTDVFELAELLKNQK